MTRPAAPVSFLCAEIGRGHPFYLDGLIYALREAGRAELIARRSDVFTLSRGRAHAAWQAVRALYHVAARGGLVAATYRRMRDRVRYDEPSRLLDLLGRDLRRWAGREGIVVVDHPLLVGALGDREDVWYMHGELVAPPEAIVHSAAGIFVPDQRTAQIFVGGGVAPERLAVTGPCVDPLLVPMAEAARRRRRKRLRSTAPLTVAVFSSGAEPSAHVQALSAAAAVLARTGHRVVVFARRGGRLERRVSAGAATSLDPVVIPFSGRDELDRQTAAHFEALDLVIGPPHERSSWAFALGLPLLIVGPDVGTFAPLNRERLTTAGVAVALEAMAEDPARLPTALLQLRRSGRLGQMLERGTGPRTDGFRRAAAALVEVVGASK
ncbi:MAG: hypothetical protein AAGF11_36180 [Myxococcota bacterium]